MSDEKRPLPAAVSEYMNDHPDATPSEVMETVGLGEHRREQIEHYCAVTWFFRYKGEEGCEVPAGVNGANVEWADVAEWDVPTSAEGQHE
ncbi:MAG TPA: hypothetical protein VFJ06_01625 [Halococcus sp.]|nr:hypothetical protein [Halococcus sp.]